MSNTNSIEKQIEIKAPQSRVWRALTDHHEFGAWFRIELEAPFVAGTVVKGRNLHPECKNLHMEFTVRGIEPESYFAYSWHPYSVDPYRNYDIEPLTLVEFRLETIAGGTRVTVTESGFDALPPDRRDEAFRKHGEGWTIQLQNVTRHVGG